MTGTGKTNPKAVRAPHGATTMEIDWGDGASSRLEHWILRGFCPCAACQGHEGPICYIDTWEHQHAALELRDIRRVGNYALGLGWGDGHASGIYTFRYLRLLGSLAGQPRDEVVRFQPPRGS
jgi:DUF971 family protein